MLKYIKSLNFIIIIIIARIVSTYNVSHSKVFKQRKTHLRVTFLEISYLYFVYSFERTLKDKCFIRNISNLILFEVKTNFICFKL